jgi:hypothetical protein
MTSLPHEFDPDDNFASHGQDPGDDDEAVTLEALTWQLLLLVNPDDDEAALQQFQAWQEAIAIHAGDGSDAHALACLRQAIDWKSGFHVEAGDAAGFVECLDELAARWNLRIDWGVEDPTDTAFLDAADVATLIGIAHDRLREHGYTLWTWNVHGAAREDVFAGFVTLRSDDESLEIVAPALGMDLRPGSAF